VVEPRHHGDVFTCLCGQDSHHPAVRGLLKTHTGNRVELRAIPYLSMVYVSSPQPWLLGPIRPLSWHRPSHSRKPGKVATQACPCDQTGSLGRETSIILPCDPNTTKSSPAPHREIMSSHQSRFRPLRALRRVSMAYLSSSAEYQSHLRILQSRMSSHHFDASYRYIDGTTGLNNRMNDMDRAKTTTNLPSLKASVSL